MSSFFAQTSGSFVSIKNVGDTFTGIISGPLSERPALDPTSKTPRTTKAGKPVMEIVIPVKEASTGIDKTWTISSWRAKQAIGDAIIAASGGKFSDPELGGQLTMSITGKDTATAIPANLFSATYVPAAQVGQQAAPQPQQQQFDQNAPQYGQQYGQPAQQYDPSTQQGYGAPQMQQQAQYGQPAQQQAPGYGQPANMPAPY